MAILLTTTIGAAGPFALIQSTDVGMPDGSRLSNLFEVDILPLTTYSDFALHPNLLIYGVQTVASYTLTVGETYFVEWDGETYECVGQDGGKIATGLVYLGNGTKWKLPGNNEPFAIAVTSDGYALYGSTVDEEAGGSHTVRIYQTKSLSGSGLPEVTADENGKILQVVDGEWEVVAFPDVSIDEETENRIAAVEESTETALGGMLSVSMRVTELETPATSVDMTEFGTGKIKETKADGSEVTYTFIFDDDGNPIRIYDTNGNSTELVGFGQMSYKSAEGVSF